MGGKAAARVGDMAKQLNPHCHSPTHPAGPVPTPVPHPGLPLKIMPPGAATVKINKKAAARLLDKTDMCKLPSCVPAGPGMIIFGSLTVKISNMLAARAGDPTLHPTCLLPIPAPVGKIQPPCSNNVKIGG